MAGPRLIVGFAIVSEDGMLANAAGVMPDALKFEADKRFFEQGMDGVDAAVHGRHSNESQPHSPQRSRLIVTRTVAKIERDPANPKARFWNPAGAPLEERWRRLAFRTLASALSGATTCSACSCRTTATSTCRGRPASIFPAAGRCFPAYRRKRRRPCWRIMVSLAARAAPSIRPRRYGDKLATQGGGAADDGPFVLRRLAKPALGAGARSLGPAPLNGLFPAKHLDAKEQSTNT